MADLMVVLTGIALGVISVVLVKYGNPGNMGYCIACFLRDISGALGFHRAAVVQYLRPEIMGLSLGAFFSSMFTKEFRPRGGSSPILRFVLGVVFMIGALIFLGCPVRAFLRLAGGDWNAIYGILGLTAGIAAGFMFVKRGFTLGRATEANKTSAYVIPLLMVGLLVLLFVSPAFVFRSASGPGAAAAPTILSLGAGLIMGILAQRSRFCTIGGIRDFIFIGDSYLIKGTIALVASAFVTNMAIGLFKAGFVGQPIAHTNGLWNFIGMAVAGMAAVLLGGCPLRQLVLSSEGNVDSGITVLGLLVGAAITHNFGLASSGTGVTNKGMIAAGISLAILLAIGLFNSPAVFQTSGKSTNIGGR
ncbi:MAG: YedE family putative selenium transporter [Bacillota bacterium]|nr:YedE family putative selenium transporter [Bacillota bacterium]